MVFSCPRCKFRAVLGDTGRPESAEPPLCPRCRTPLYSTGLEQQPGAVAVGPWEKRSSWLDLPAYWRTALSILFCPSSTFASLHYNAGIRSSLVFAIFYGSLGQILGRYWFTLAGIQFGDLGASPLDNAARFTAWSLATPVFLGATLLLGCVLVHLALRILAGAHRPVSATFQVMAYVSGATALLNLLPLLGSLLIPPWAFILNCVGLARAHHISKVRSFLAMVLPFILGGLLVAGIVFVIAAAAILELLRNLGL